jgi:hypothetical protein
MKRTIFINNDNVATMLSNGKRRNKAIKVKSDSVYAKQSCRMCPYVLTDCCNCNNKF